MRREPTIAAGHGEGRDAEGQLSALTALVFAGSSGAPAREQGQNKCFFPLRDRPVVQHQLDLVGSLGFGRIVLVTEPERLDALDLPAGTIVLPAEARQSDNFASVKRHVPFGEQDRCLALLGDTPLVTRGMVLDFLERCRRWPGDFQHGLVPYVFAEPFMDFFPRPLKGRQPFHLREFRARLGGLTVVRPAAFDPEKTRQIVGAVMSGRRQDPDTANVFSYVAARARVVWGGLRFVGPLGVWMGSAAILAHWIHQRGFPNAASFIRRPVSLARLDAVMSRLLACETRFIPCPFGGPSLDVDGELDVAVHERHFESMRRLSELQERLAPKLVEPEFDLGREAMEALERFDAEAAAEIRRHPEVYRQQRRILLRFEGGASSRSHAA